MEEKIRQLYIDTSQITVDYLFLKKRNIVERAWKLFPQLQKFSSWFLLENEFDIEEDVYLYMKVQLMEILKDYMEGIEKKDMVLLHDALDYGLVEFLKPFISEEKKEV